MSVKENISMIIYSIYKIVNNVNGKVYIGMTKQREKRFKIHSYLSESDSPQLLIQKKMKEYGKYNFHFEIIYETLSLSHCQKMESFFIKDFDTLTPKGYNVHTGGNYSTVHKASEKLKHRMKHDNPGKTELSLYKKTSVIEAKNLITNQTFVVENRKLFAEANDIPYTSIGWALQHGKNLKNTWYFSYVRRRTMGA
jgi:group I intron endonuclease